MTMDNHEICVVVTDWLVIVGPKKASCAWIQMFMFTMAGKWTLS